jgi:hypothetical protein
MSKLIVFTNLTLDGVMQAPGRPDEDRRGGFEHGGWATPYNAMAQAGESMPTIPALGTAIGYGGQIDQPRRTHFGLLFLSFDWTDRLLHPMGFRAPTLLSSSSNRPLPFCEAPCR